MEERAVRDACLRYYGTNSVMTELVDIRVTVGNNVRLKQTKGSLYLFGKVVAKAFGRDSGASTGKGIILESGGFSTGGSYINWTVFSDDETAFIMRDAPKQLVDEYDGALEIEVLPTNETINREALISEKERLVARLAEIQTLLG